MSPEARPDDRQVLIYVPFGRDAVLIQRALSAAHIESHVCNSQAGLETGILKGAGLAILGDEALPARAVESLAECVGNQPPWSDLPLLIMTSGGIETEASRDRLELLKPLGNVTLLERPLRRATLISAVRGALRARRRQYEIRDLLEQRQLDASALEQSNQQLHQANADLEQFAYSASHDLREPLRIISIYSQLLKKKYDGALGAEGAKYIHYTVDSANRMEQLLRDLLLFSQSAANDLPPPTVDANRALDRALANLRTAIEESAASIECDHLPELRVHEVHLEQLFQNLIGNSLKYRGESKPCIQIRVQPQRDFWVFSVADNGIGVDKQYADLIFGIFKRLHPAEDYPGTGIGLAICKKIVERYRGRIWVESELEQGATFFFSLPR